MSIWRRSSRCCSRISVSRARSTRRHRHRTLKAPLPTARCGSERSDPRLPPIARGQHDYGNARWCSTSGCSRTRRVPDRQGHGAPHALRRTAAASTVETESKSLTDRSSPMQLSILQASRPMSQRAGPGRSERHDSRDDRRPAPRGALGIKGGSFAVPELGTQYTGSTRKSSF